MISMELSRDDMKVTKRNGTREIVNFNKIKQRITTVGKKHKITINFTRLCLKVIDQLYDNIATSKIDDLMAEQCASLLSEHPDYGKLAASLTTSNIHKNTNDSFYQTMSDLYEFEDFNGNKSSLISEKIWCIIKNNKDILESIINYDNDYLFDYFGLKTLERAYLMKINNKIVERPQHMWLRVSLGIHGDDIESVKQTYKMMSELRFTHATPTLFNSGTPRPQLSSCFLLAMKEDSISGIYDTLSQCASISKWAGGIGLHIHNIRGKNSHIRGTNGKSNGIVPMLRNFNETARYVDQGGGKRNGSFAIYLEPWHSDILEFLELRKNHGDENARARDLFYGLWINDEFMQRVNDNDDWYLFCPDICPGLSEKYGREFNLQYNEYIISEKYSKKIKARTLWFAILDSQMETGTPYLLYKDACNQKSNQKNLGTIKSSNLCTEIIEYSSPTESAVCNLASISLPKCVENNKFNYIKLHKITKIITRNLNKIIDVNYYPTIETKRSNLLHRPIGIGVQGLADTFALLDLPFDSEISKQMNKSIFETIYHAALECSNELAIERKSKILEIKTNFDNNNIIIDANEDVISNNFNINKDTLPNNLNDNNFINIIKNNNIIKNELIHLDNEFIGSYSSFKNSPTSLGILQFDMWNIKPNNNELYPIYDWDKIKESIKINGIRNSLLIAPMPTASTSQILGNNECFEPFTSNIYSRRTLAGEFTIVNKHLVKDLLKLDLWNKEIKDCIISNRGSVQNIDILPQWIKDKYKIVWEISMKSVIDMAADRGAFIDQSQSMNLWMEDPNYKTLTSMHFYGWKKGLKTGQYYLRRKPKHNPQQFTIDPNKKMTTGEKTNITDSSNNNLNNTSNNDECEMCGS